MLIRADKTARISAEAAKKNATVAEDALFVAQRPYLFVEDINFAVQIMAVQMRGQGIPHVIYRIRNEGKTPAAIIEVSQQFIFDKFLPGDPDYWVVDEFPETRAVGAGKHQDLNASRAFGRLSGTAKP